MKISTNTSSNTVRFFYTLQAFVLYNPAGDKNFASFAYLQSSDFIFTPSFVEPDRTAKIGVPASVP